ncbi:SPASM domain-containing protein [Candidatus Bathyarchaeota archaeon]|nr:SPASM domain-containing protein [Candidatus Bathyarchaeota archaeon]
MWLNEYNKGITKLVCYFGDELKRGKVHGIVPFIPILKTLLTGVPTPHIRCGSGRDSFAIMSDGRIDVCPIAPELSFSKVGNIITSNPHDLKYILSVGEPCSICDIKWICGGRCLFVNKTMFWGRPLFDRVCKSTRHMIYELNYLINEIKKLLEDGIIHIYDFNYPKINNGCKIIP